MNISTHVAYSPLTHNWYVTVASGEWDTYKEAVYVGPTKPTAREIRSIVKQAKHALVPIQINF